MKSLALPAFSSEERAATAATRMKQTVLALPEIRSRAARSIWSGQVPPVLFHGTPGCTFARFRDPAFFSFAAATARIFSRGPDAADGDAGSGVVIPVYGFCTRVEHTDRIDAVEHLPYDRAWRRAARARGVEALLYRGEDGDELAVLDTRCLVSAVAPEPLLRALLGDPLPSAIDGAITLPGVVADVVAKPGLGASIYSWSGDGSGRTSAALAALRGYGGKLCVFDIGAPGSRSYRYWNHMHEQGLVDDCFDEEDNRIVWADSVGAPGHASTGMTV